MPPFNYYSVQFCIFLSKQITELFESGMHPKLSCLITSSEIYVSIYFVKLTWKNKVKGNIHLTFLLTLRDWFAYLKGRFKQNLAWPWLWIPFLSSGLQCFLCPNLLGSLSCISIPLAIIASLPSDALLNKHFIHSTNSE